MDLATIQSLVAHGESESLEFKRSTGQRSRIAETACAMSNSRSGTILVGVLDDGLIRGQQVTLSRHGEATLSQILADTPGSIAARTVQDNLSMLRGFGLVDSSGRGRGARWRLRRLLNTHKNES